MICTRDMRQRGTLRPLHKLALSQSPIQAAPLEYIWNRFVHLKIILLLIMHQMLFGAFIILFLKSYNYLALTPSSTTVLFESDDVEIMG